MSRKALLVTTALLAFVAVFATATNALAATPDTYPNVKCLECHSATGVASQKAPVFSVPDVIPAINADACNKCHWGTLRINTLTLGGTTLTNGFNHRHSARGACANCHPSISNVYDATRGGTYLDPVSGGRYASAGSLSLPAWQMHAIHSQDSWPAALTSASMGRPADYCKNCHKAVGCNVCHTGVDASSHDGHVKLSTESTHVAQPYSYSVGGLDAAGFRLTSPVVNAPTTCIASACHPVATLPVSPRPWCGSCHPSETNTHGYDTSQHTSGVADEVDGGGKVCADCHQMGLYAEHQRDSSVSKAAKCTVCHPAPRSSYAAWGKTCQQGDCHPVGTGSEPHANESSAHQPLSTGAAAECTTCHDDGDLAVIHVEATSTVDPAITSCLVCHSSTSVPSTKDCTSCHFAYDSHPYPQAKHLSSSALTNCGGAGCHSTRDLMDVHAEKNAAYGCSDCHGSTRTEVISAIAAGKTGCSDCHPAVSETVGHYAQHWANPLLFDGSNAYYAWVTGSAAGGNFTDECFGCHTSNLMDEHLGTVDPASGIATRAKRYDDQGEALSCASCHSALPGTLVSNAIVAGVTKCDGCHVVHDQIPAVHASTYVADPAVPCAPCHSARLDGLHNGEMSSTTPSGKVLTACNICHANYESPRGPVVQAAITAHDTDCTACHAVAHPDKGGHTASAAASLECARCHAKGASAVDIRAIHSKASAGACKVCHENPDRISSITAKSAECSSCHSNGQFHTQLPAKHTNAGMSSDCLGSQCHAKTLPDAHDEFIAGQSVYATTCDLCHLNLDSNRIPSDATAACDSCHTVHGTPDHSANSSAACVACHESGDVLQLHKKNDGSANCALCHDNPIRVPTLPATVDCVNCHATVSPADPNHYASSKHTASEGSEYGYSCSTCHELDMKPEHAKTTSGPTSCAQCHEGKVDAFTSPWDKTCSKCHTVRHAETAVKHASSTSSCAGTNCHAITDVTVLHSTATTTVAGVTYTACRVCHRDGKTVPNTTTCTDCHAGHGDLTAAHQAPSSAACVLCHETSGVMSLHKKADGSDNCAVCHDNPARVPALPATTACVNCHGTLSPADPNHYASAKHTAADGTESGYACSVCHKLDMKPEHLKTSSGSVTCEQCHEGRVDNLATAWGNTCAECHTVRHGDATSRHTSSTSACAGANCHGITDVTALHSTATTTVAGVTYTNCRVCHRNSDSVPTTTTCTSCHAGHGDITVLHTATASGPCTSCHETGNVMSLHKKADGSGNCAVCHDNPTRVPTLPATVDCVNCHGTLSPADPKHYSATKHTATDGAEDGYACSACHSLDMKAAHAAAAVTCVACHETKVDGFTGAWDKTCTKCHATRHTAKAVGHKSTKTACAGTGCHVITDVSALHSAAPNKCATCHAVGKTPVTDCGTTGCHPTITGDHEPVHDTTGIIDAGCYGCHFKSLTKEHSALGYTCSTCHASTNSAVKAAISGGNIACSACHPAVNGKNRHANQSANEFIIGNSSGHRVYDTLPAMRTSFKVGSSTYTWPLPTTFLKSGWTSSSVVGCDDCHTFSSSASGPHGAAVGVNMDPAYSSSWETARLGSTNSTIICSKCHTSYSSMNDVHAEGDHDGEACIACHTKLPHGWRLPRMLAYTSDPVTYSSTRLSGLSLTNHTPGSGWSESDCAANCEDHSSSMSSKWPSTVQTFGSVTGTVKNSAGVAVSGATVTAGGVSATSGTEGKYTLAGVSTGSVTVTASKTGFGSATKTVTVVANGAVTADLVLSDAAENLALGKTATASSQYSSSNGPLYAVDGSTATYWRSSSSGTQWLRVDLGSSQSVSKVVINWNGSYYARSYQVQTSADGYNFTTVASVSSSGSGIKTHTFTSVNARYVRLYCTTGYGSNYRVNEFQVWDF